MHSFPSMYNLESYFTEVAEMLPQILSQMGPESLEHVKRFAYTGATQKFGQTLETAAKVDAGEQGDAEDSDDEVPDLLSNFDVLSKDEKWV